MTGAEKLLTVAQVAERCQCSDKTIRRAINAGDLVAVRLGQSAKSDRIREADFQAYLNGAVRRTAPALIVPVPDLRDTTVDERLRQLLGVSRTNKPKQKP